MRKCVYLLCACCLILAAASSVVFAARGDLLATYPYAVQSLVLDSARNVVYASLPDLNNVVVINGTTLDLIATIPVGVKPKGLALSPDRSCLYVANAESMSISIIDTGTFSVITTWAVPYYPHNIAIGADRLFITSDKTIYHADSRAMMVDLGTGDFVDYFGLGMTSGNDFLEISPDQDALFLGKRGTSGSHLTKFDLSSGMPVVVYNADAGGNGQDLTLSHSGNELYFCCGGGNFGLGYVIAKIRTSDMVVTGTLNSSYYPTRLALSPDDSVAYVEHWYNHVDLFNTITCSTIGTISIPGTVNDWPFGSASIVDSSGKRLFITLENSMLVYDTGFAPLPLEVDVDIRPGIYPNEIDLASKKTVPVAVLTTSTFDAADIDPTTVLFAGVLVAKKGGGPKARLLAVVSDVDGDGDQDLLMQFATKGMQLDLTSTSAGLTGSTFAGDPVQGSDSVVVTRMPRH